MFMPGKGGREEKRPREGLCAPGGDGAQEVTSGAGIVDRTAAVELVRVEHQQFVIHGGSWRCPAPATALSPCALTAAPLSSSGECSPGHCQLVEGKLTRLRPPPIPEERSVV